MSRQLVATLTTDSNGEATFTYTGTGIGKIGFDAKYGSFQSETYDVLDCTVYDGMETETYKNYYKASNTADLSYSTEWAVTGTKSLKWDYDASTTTNKYWGIMYNQGGSTSFSIASLLDKSLRFVCDVKSSCDFSIAQNKGFYMSIFCQAQSLGTGWQTLGTVRIDGGEHIGDNAYSVDFTVPSDATQLWVRFNGAGSLETGNTLYVDNWKMYPIQTE